MSKQTPVKKWWPVPYEHWFLKIYQLSNVKENSPEYKELIKKYGGLMIQSNRDVYYPVYQSHGDKPEGILTHDEALDVILNFVRK